VGAEWQLKMSLTIGRGSMMSEVVFTPRGGGNGEEEGVFKHKQWTSWTLRRKRRRGGRRGSFKAKAVDEVNAERDRAPLV
jgi:hypothetical protein